MFALLVFGNLVGIAICLWMAAGYTLEDFLAPFGLRRSASAPSFASSRQASAA